MVWNEAELSSAMSLGPSDMRAHLTPTERSRELQFSAPSWPIGLSFPLRGIVYVESDCLPS